MTTLPPSSVYTVSGAVTVAGSAGAADLVAEQTVTSSGWTYEIVSTSTTSGPYSSPLVSAGLWLGTYSTTLPLVLAQGMAGSDVGIGATNGGTRRTAAGDDMIGREPWQAIPGRDLSVRLRTGFGT